MISNYYTLKIIVNELNQNLPGYEITEVFTQSKNELIISLSRDEVSKSLQISIDPANCFILLRDAIKKAKNNSVNLFPELLDQYIEKVILQDNDRIVKIRLHNGYELIITFFRGESNIYFVDSENRIIHAFKNDKKYAQNIFSVARRDLALDKFLLSSDDMQKSIRNTHEKNIVRILSKILPSMGTLLAREIIHRSNIDPDLKANDLSNIDLNQIWQKFKQVYSDLQKPHFNVYYENEKPIEFSILDLFHLEKYENKDFNNIFEAMTAFLFVKRGEKARDKQKVEYIKKIDNELLFLKSSIQKLENELVVNRADEYQKFGNILMSDLEKINVGEKEYEYNEENTGNVIKILLDPALTSVQNATHYFEKAKKAKEAKKITEKRLEDSKIKFEVLNGIFSKLKTVKDSNEYIQTFYKYRKDLEKYGIMETEEKQKELTLFRKFIVDGGFEVLCGKNSDNNDLLTFRYSKPNDLWFHARGSGGSHVVLKIDSGKGEPGKKAVHQAASIAAYYSQAKNATITPVAMTKKKYVRKPKGAKPGTVTIQQEKVVFVEPKLPEN